MKILSVLFDYTRYEAKDADEMNTYFALNVDPTARPLVINVDYNEATYRVTEHIQMCIRDSVSSTDPAVLFYVCMVHCPCKWSTFQDFILSVHI